MRSSLIQGVVGESNEACRHNVNLELLSTPEPVGVKL